jgi:hypothetical protein
VVGYDLSYLTDLQDGVKLIIDNDIVDPTVKFQNDGVLEGRSYAFRRAFGGATVYAPEIQVPYVHRPTLPDDWETEVNKRDCLIFDLHKWLVVEAQLSMLALMIDIGRRHNVWSKLLGRRLNLYLTGLIRPEPYFGTIEFFQFLNRSYHVPNVVSSPVATAGDERWGRFISNSVKDEPLDLPLDFGNPERNPLDVFVKNLIKPLENQSDFLRLFSRSIGFITDHGDIADQDVSTCLALGIPVLTVARSPWKKSAGIGTTLKRPIHALDEEFYRRLIEASAQQLTTTSGLEALLTLPPQPPIPLHHFETLYDKTWDILNAWMEHGTRDESLSREINRSERWNFGMR